MTINALRYVEELKQAGVPSAQAEAHAKALYEFLKTEDLTTKRDLRELEYRLIFKPGGLITIVIGLFEYFSKA